MHGSWGIAFSLVKSTNLPNIVLWNNNFSTIWIESFMSDYILVTAYHETHVEPNHVF